MLREGTALRRAVAIDRTGVTWSKAVPGLITAVFYAVSGLAGIAVGGCGAKSDNVRYEYPRLDDSVRPNSDIPQAGTDFLDDD